MMLLRAIHMTTAKRAPLYYYCTAVQQFSETGSSDADRKKIEHAKIRTAEKAETWVATKGYFQLRYNTQVGLL